jgi:hypothetical protein
MARIVDLAVEASGVLRSYSSIHEELLGASVVRWALRTGLRKSIDFSSLEKRLKGLESELADIRTELAGLSAQDLTKRGRDDVQTELDIYAQTLAHAIGKLRVICRKMGEAEATGASRAAYTTEQLNHDKIAYDDAVQEYKRHGMRLKHLLSSY